MLPNLNLIFKKSFFLFQEKEDEFVSLKCLMTEENETVHQIEVEMQRLMKIISDDKQLIQEKDLLITKLREIEMKELREEQDDEAKVEHFKKALSESEAEIESLKSNLLNQRELSTTHALLQSKMSDLMNIIEEQNKQIKNLNEKEKRQEIIFQRNEILQKELHVLKVLGQQKDSDIKSLNQLLESRDTLLREQDNNPRILDFEANILVKDEEIEALQKRVCMEQENHKQTEDELIKLRLEFDTLKNKNTTINDRNDMEKDEIISDLQSRLLHEQQIAAHVQFAQEKEIIDKESHHNKKNSETFSSWGLIVLGLGNNLTSAQPRYSLLFPLL